MDVRCEQCQTEYELDDARITDAGVTVKCAQCNHVFKVKRKTLLVTVPLRPGEIGEASVLTPGASSATHFEKDRGREWQLRQKGQVVLIRELSSLQRWIVERRTSRDDELSLNGALWNRLGDIPELEPFFAIVEQAQRAELALARMPTPLENALPGVRPDAPQRTVSAELDIVVAPEGDFATPTPTLAPTPVPPTAPGFAGPGALPGALDDAPPLPGGFGMDLPGPITAELPAFRDAALARRRRSRVVLPVLLLAAAAIVSAYVYAGVLKRPLPGGWTPERARGWALAQWDRFKNAAEREPKSPAVVEPVTKTFDIDAGAPPVATREPATESPPAAQTVPTPVPAASAQAEPSVAVENPKPDDAAKAEPRARREPNTFEQYLALGNRLRERERFQQALVAYGKAVAMEPENVEALTGRAMVLLDLDERLEAETAFLAALKADPRHLEAVMGLAETYRAMNRKADAVKYYERYLELAPSGPEAPVARSAVQKLRN
ncbi:MAG: zinc-ribbon domain-containing protein [Myxococcaceae bacterium]